MIKRSSGKALFFWVALPFLLALGALILIKPWRPPKDSLQAVMDHWSMQKYLPISTDQEFLNKLDTLKIESNFEMESAQKQKLREKLRNLLLAIHLNSYENYRKVLQPFGSNQFNGERLAALRNYYMGSEMAVLNPSGQIPEEPEPAFQKLWEIRFENRYATNEWATQIVGKPYWTGISLGNSLIEVQKETTMPASIRETIYRRKSNGASSTDTSSFRFERTPQSILDVEGTLTTATFILLIRHYSPEFACPNYFRFYWDKESGEWLPMAYGRSPSNYARSRELIF